MKSIHWGLSNVWTYTYPTLSILYHFFKRRHRALLCEEYMQSRIQNTLLSFFTYNLQGYLRWKMIISENIAFEAQFNNFKLRSVLKCSIFHILTVPSTPKVMTSWWLLEYELEYTFEYIFWVADNLVIKQGPIIDIVMSTVLGAILHDFEDWIPDSNSFSIG